MSGWLATPGRTETLHDHVARSIVSGDLRTYYFTRDYRAAAIPNQAAFSLGGRLNLETAPVRGLNGVLTFYTANSLGLNAGDPAKVDKSLPGDSVTAIGQAYLQYHHSFVALRAGNQLVSSPWMNPSDSRMIPSTFQGVCAAARPTRNFEIVVMRMFGFKGRTANAFSRTNLVSDRDNNGVLSTGIRYARFDVIAQAWYYRFYDFAQLLHADLHFTIHLSHTVAPFMATQFIREWSDGHRHLGTVDASVYSIMAGVTIHALSLLMAATRIPSNTGAYDDGNVLSPYTSLYNTGPIYTNSMISGMVKKAPGEAYKVSVTYSPLKGRFRLFASYARYHTMPYTNNTSETDIDVTYFPHRLEGLSIRDRVGIEHGAARTGTFMYNRFMLQYEF